MYPEIFDFTKNDSLIIEYGMEDPEKFVGITFNEEANDLTCQDIGREVKRCTVPKSHFKGKKSGYYFTKHSNHLNGKSYSYEAPPIKVILNDSKGNIISFISYYWLLLILIMI